MIACFHIRYVWNRNNKLNDIKHYTNAIQIIKINNSLSLTCLTSAKILEYL